MGKPAARLTDMHVCPMSDGPKPHVGGPITAPGCPTVLIGGLPAARVGDMATCVGPPDSIIVGAFTVLIGGQPAARMGDQCAHGGTIVMGFPMVLIGESGSGGGGGGAAAANASSLAALFEGAAKNAAAVVPAKAPVLASTFGKAIKIDGDEAFRRKTLAALEEISKTPTGKNLLESLEARGKTVTIKPTTKGNAVEGFGKGAMVGKDGKAGGGSDCTVKFNPDREKIGDEKWETRPPAVGLAHELIHADHVAGGTVDTTKVQNDSKKDPADPAKFATEMNEEVRTTGIEPHDKEVLSENKIRSEWDPKQPKREWY